MNYLDSAFEWGINPQNAKNLNQQQINGLASLAPQSGLGLNLAPHPIPLNPGQAFPEPQFAKNAGKYFQFESQADKSYYDPLYGSSPIYDKNQAFQAHNQLDAAGAPGAAKPYFDPNYPNESMLALKNWLTPQLEAGASEALHGRGIDYSGTAGATAQKGLAYLNQLSPVGLTGQRAMAMDFNRLYGPNITNSLINGSTHVYGTPRENELLPGYSSPPDHILPTIQGADPFGNGTSNVGATFVNNKNYKEGDPSSPLFGLINFGPNQSGYQETGYVTPGYIYNPEQMPDYAKMPWLAPAKTTSPTSGTAP